MDQSAIDTPDLQLESTDYAENGIGQPIPDSQLQTQARTIEQNGMLKFIGDVLTAAKENIWGDTWWLSTDTTKVLAIPAKQLAANHLELERRENFLLLKGTYPGSVIYHIVIVWRKDGKMYSVWRNEMFAVVIDFFRRVAPFFVLLQFIDDVRDVKLLLTSIGKHPLWKPVHIAARMNLQKFFEDAHAKETLPMLLKQACHPEGRYPIHSVIFYDYVELAKTLFSFGASVAQADANGCTALHYGARSSSAMLEVLCAHPEAKQCINALNSDGYTPLFLAIKGCRPACITTLRSHDAVVNVSGQGRSALHEAMLQNNARVKDVIQTLVQASPEAVTETDPVTKNSLLHIANNKTSLAALLAVAPMMDRNVKNKAGRTALQWHVQKDNLGLVVTLIIMGVDLDAKDNEGNTALHLAVSRSNLDIVRALLVLGSTVNVTNASGDTPLHMSVGLKGGEKFEITRSLIVCGAQRCPKDKQGCTIQCAYREPGSPPRYSSEPVYVHVVTDVDEKMPLDSRPVMHTRGVLSATTGARSRLDEFVHKKCVKNVEQQCIKNEQGEKPKFETILTLDGGGIRGLILVQTLLALERELGGEPLLKYFDWMAGTSTGALLAAALAVGKSLRDCQHMYLKFKDDIFEGWRPYSAEVLEKFIIDLTGAKTTMADLKKSPKVIITTTAADKIPITLHLFRNYRLPIDDHENLALGYLDPSGQLLWKALRCSSAAPTYFTSVESKFVDGGLAANNPTMEVLTEIQRYNNALDFSAKGTAKLRVGCAVSLGTGLMPAIPALTIDISATGKWSFLRTFGLMLIAQACAAEGRPVERARAWLQEMGAPLYRLNPLLSKDYLLDTKDDKEIVSMLWEAEEYARQEVDLFKELAAFLKVMKE